MAQNDRLLIAQLDVSIRSLERSMKRAGIVVDQTSNKMERRWEKKNRRMQRSTMTSAAAMRTALASVGGALVLGGAIRTLAEFEQSMATVKAVTGATADQFARMTEVAKDLGATTRFTASQAADGMLMLARAGLTADQAMAALPDTLKLAQAGALDLGDASDIVTNVMSGMRLEVDQLTRVGDVLTKVANSANTDVQQLGVAFSYAAPIANNFGLSLEETAAALGIFSNNGIKAERAGTSLNNIMARLHNRTDKGIAILEKYGLTYDELDVSVNGLVPVLQKLEKANMSAADSMALFAIRGSAGANILSKQRRQFLDLMATAQDAGGEMDRVATIMDDNLNGAIKRLQSAMQAFILEAGEGGGLTTVVDSLAGALRFAANNADTFMIAAAAIASTTIPALTTAAYGLMAALGPIPITIAAITTAYLALKNIAPETTNAMDEFNDTLNRTRELLPELNDRIDPAIQEIEAMGDAAETASNQFMSLVQNMVKTVQSSRALQLLSRQQEIMGQVGRAQNRLRGGFTGTAAQYETFKQNQQRIIDEGTAAIAAIQEEIDQLEYTPLEVFMEGIKSGEVKDALTITTEAGTDTPEVTQAGTPAVSPPDSLGGFGREERVGLDPVPDPLSQLPVNLNPFADFDREKMLREAAENEENKTAFRDMFRGAITEAIETGDVGGAIKSVFADRAAAGLEKALDAVADAIFDAFGGSGGIGGFFSSLFGGGKSGGGPVMAGRPYRVGEGDRPEFLQSKGKLYMIPGDNGTVIPNGSIKGARSSMGGASFNTNVVVQGSITEEVWPKLQDELQRNNQRMLAQVPGIARATAMDDRSRGRY